MRRFLAFTILATASLGAVAQDSHDDRFPLMAWDYVDNPAILQSMHDAGITSVAFVPVKMLDACERLQMDCIVVDEKLSGQPRSKPFDGDQFRKNLPEVINEVGKRHSPYGFHVKDEPGEVDFPGLAKAVAAVKDLAPGKWPYINLLPGEGPSYDAYIEHFVEIVHPTALSYDRYSVIGDVGSGDFDPKFWSNLEQMRKAAIRYHLPFWNIVLSSPHWRYRDLTPADLRLQVWGSLAYGVSGISYYKFISKELPIHDAPDLGNWRDGPLNQFEEKTPTLDWMRELNLQIQNIAPVYLKLHSDDVYHFGDVPAGNHGVTEQSLVKQLPPGDFVVGDFTGPDGSRYALIVNKSLKRSVSCDPQFRIPVKEVRYASRTGTLKPYPGRLYWLAPGQGVLLQLLPR